MNLHSKRTSRLPLSAEQRALMQVLHRRALQYFIDNQMAHGLILDRQRNHGRRSRSGLCSLSATGMGLIALVLASRKHHALLTQAQARARIREALRTALSLPHQHGMMPHFVHARSLKPVGSDVISTVDSAWLIAGALWAAQALGDRRIRAQAERLYNRVNWRFWSETARDRLGLLSHGMDAQGRKLPGVWDRFNAEAAFMYVLGIGARRGAELPAASWFALEPLAGDLAGRIVPSADLGLFVFQYSLLLLDGDRLPAVKGWKLGSACREAMAAHHHLCRLLGSRYATFQSLWGLSAGDGPTSAPVGTHEAETDHTGGCARNSRAPACTIDPGQYRAYAPLGPIDGTAHLTATLACLPESFAQVAANMEAALANPLARRALGRYGFSNVNLDRGWISRDIVGIDAGAAAIALENALYGNSVQRVFQSLPAIRRALRRLNAAARRS